MLYCYWATLPIIIFTEIQHLLYFYWTTAHVLLLLSNTTCFIVTEIQHLLYWYWATAPIVFLLRYSTCCIVTELQHLTTHSIIRPAVVQSSVCNSFANFRENFFSSFILIRLADCFMLNWVTVVIGKTVKPVNLKSVLTIAMNDNTIFILRVKFCVSMLITRKILLFSETFDRLCGSSSLLVCELTVASPQGTEAGACKCPFIST